MINTTENATQIGIQGNIGNTGNVGNQGIPGILGICGLQGLQGFIGPRGIDGEIGNQGNIGIDGPQGIIGLIGPIGPDGIQQIGETGNAGLISGLIGPIGPSGIQGPIGGSNISFSEFYGSPNLSYKNNEEIKFDVIGSNYNTSDNIYYNTSDDNYVLSTGKYIIFYSLYLKYSGYIIILLNNQEVYKSLSANGISNSRVISKCIINVTQDNTKLNIYNANYDGINSLQLVNNIGGSKIVNQNLIIKKIS